MDSPDDLVITFDCYGTLIDWETGIKNAFQIIIGKDSAKIPGIFELYEEEEKKIEKLSYRPYKQVLSEALSAATERGGFNLSQMDSEILSEELPKWKPFPDTNPSLEKLAKNHTLGILSNVDDDLLTGTLKQLDARFDIIVTAEKVRSYKPSRGHFKEAARIIGRRSWIHAASSLYHDIEPANMLGIESVWVNRKQVRLDTISAGKVRTQVSDLAQLAQLLQ